MKKVIIVILSIFLIIMISIYMNYRQAVSKELQAKKFNQDYEFFNKEAILGTDVTTMINKAMDNNEKHGIKKDENGVYIPDDEYSVKIYVYMIINEQTYPMEQLVKTGLSEFTRYFGEVHFNCTDVKYHKTNGRIAEMTFASTEL